MFLKESLSQKAGEAGFANQRAYLFSRNPRIGRNM